MNESLTADAFTWPGWRGVARDGHVGWLPERLPEHPAVVWRHPLSGNGVGGIAATRERVVVSDRDLADVCDVFHCLDAKSGREMWTCRYPAPGKLDYGNSPRATPLFYGDHVFLFGAFGHLTCVELATGIVAWQFDVRDTFDITSKMPWGLCGSPLIAAGRLVVNPGGKLASLVALQPLTGEVDWKTRGRPAAYGSFIAAQLGGKLQLVGYDESSLGGWDAVTGKRLWTLTPEYPNDFNVPTPLVHRGQLLVSTENNGTRMYGFTAEGKIEKKPIAVCADLAPDTQTPVIANDRLFGVAHELYCLDLKNNLKTLWTGTDPAFQSHASLVATDERLLVWSAAGELVLIDATADEMKLTGRFAVLSDESDLLAHPAFVDKQVYIRAPSEVMCLSLVS